VGVTGLGLLLILSGSCGRSPKTQHQETRWTVGAADEQPDSVSYATTYVLYDLALQSSASVQATRSRCRSAKDFSNMCDDSGAASEAIIGLLGAGGDATTEGLLKLIAVQLDGGLAESRECEIGRRGRSLLPALRSMDATRAANWCKLEFEALSKRQLAGITDVRSTQICQPANQIERDRQEWIKSFEAGQEGCGYE
jgi:hypothetical protein